jgi:hypothetical protein
MEKLRIVTVGRSLTRPFRPPISLDTIVARTEGYTYAARVWALSKGRFLSPRAEPERYDSQLFHRCTLRVAF